VRRSPRLILALAAAAVTLAACGSDGSSATVATVNGVDVPRAQLEEWVREATETNPELDPVQLQADLLSRVIQRSIVQSAVDELGLVRDEELISAVRNAIVDEVGGASQFAVTLSRIGYPISFFDEVFLVTEANIDTIVLSLIGDRSLETRTARHILVETAEEADEVYRLLTEEGVDFAELAEERSQDPGSAANGGELGARERGVFVPEFDAAVWSAELDVVLEPVESQFGFHVIEVIASERRSGTDLTANERRSLVFAELDEILNAALENAVVVVDPSIGEWDPMTGNITRQPLVG
jgi:parvulin-like peptidyl-prolyl isomerase